MVTSSDASHTPPALGELGGSGACPSGNGRVTGGVAGNELTSEIERFMGNGPLLMLFLSIFFLAVLRQ